MKAAEEEEKKQAKGKKGGMFGRKKKPPPKKGKGDSDELTNEQVRSRHHPPHAMLVHNLHTVHPLYTLRTS